MSGHFSPLTEISHCIWTAIAFWASLFLSQVELGNRSLRPYIAYFALLPPVVVGLAAIEIYDWDRVLTTSVKRYEYCSCIWLTSMTVAFVFRIWNWLPFHHFVKRKWDDWTKNLNDLSKRLILWTGLLLVLSWTQRLYFSSIPNAISDQLFPEANDWQGNIAMAVLLLIAPLLLIRIFHTRTGVVVSLISYGLLLIFNKEFVGERWSFNFWEAMRDEPLLVFIYVPLSLLLILLNPFKISKVRIERKHYWTAAKITAGLAVVLFCWINANYNLSVLTAWRFEERWQVAHEATNPGFLITLKSDGDGDLFEQWFDIELDASINRIKKHNGPFTKVARRNYDSKCKH